MDWQIKTIRKKTRNADTTWAIFKVIGNFDSIVILKNNTKKIMI